MCVISRKQFFADKSLNTVLVPKEISAIEDWAYAFCPGLKEIRIPLGCRVSGKAFQGSEALERICLYQNDEQEIRNACPELLALSILVRPQYTAVALSKAVDETAFFTWFDGILQEYLHEDDALGYSPFPAGGEEDYGDEEESYIRSRQLQKARMVFERLACGPGKEQESFCLEWLRRHNPEIPFALIKASVERRALYEKIYFQYCLQDAVETELLLQTAGEDPRLRALILKHVGEAADPLSFLKL